MVRPRFALRTTCTALALLFGAACTSTDAITPPPPGALSGQVVVFAASSLTGAFTEIADAFSAAHPGVSFTLNFAGSSELAGQIGEGAPADVFAAADEANMTKVTAAGLASGSAALIARNTFEIIVEEGNPTGVTGLADLSDSELLVVLCAPAVPCGAGAAEVLANAGVDVTPVSLEDKVKGVVTKVTSGEADAGIVFATDVLAAGDDAAGVEIPAEVNVISDLSLVVLRDAPNPPAAAAFVGFVAGVEGRAILASYGFLAP